jgi:hypothetical protein
VSVAEVYLQECELLLSHTGQYADERLIGCPYIVAFLLSLP